MSRLFRSITAPGWTRFLTAVGVCTLLSVATWTAFSVAIHRYRGMDTPLAATQSPLLGNNPKVRAADRIQRADVSELVTIATWSRLAFTLAPLLIVLHEVAAVVKWKRQQREPSALTG